MSLEFQNVVWLGRTAISMDGKPQSKASLWWLDNNARTRKALAKTQYNVGGQWGYLLRGERNMEMIPAEYKIPK
jgi:hypothetical protein